MPEWLRKKNAGRGANGASGLDDPESRAEYPALYEFLTVDRWDEKTPRRTGSLTLFVEDDVFKACLNDRDAQLVAFVSASSLRGLLEAANAMIASGEGDWRASSGARTKKR